MNNKTWNFNGTKPLPFWDSKESILKLLHLPTVDDASRHSESSPNSRSHVFANVANYLRNSFKLAESDTELVLLYWQINFVRWIIYIYLFTFWNSLFSSWEDDMLKQQHVETTRLFWFCICYGRLEITCT